jgi:integrase
MSNTTVSIRERAKDSEGNWCWSPKIPIPERNLTDAESRRRGNFYLVWTERGKKREQRIKTKLFEAAVKAARAKERHLEDIADGFERPDPLQKKRERITISDGIEERLHGIELAKHEDTLKAHRQALRQFERWTNRRYVDEIDHDHLMEFRNWLIKSGNEKRTACKKGNEQLTANWKVMRVNQFVKKTLDLPDGKGPTKKSDLGKMKPNGPVKIYSKVQLDGFFSVCDSYDELRYRLLYEAALRKKELIYLEFDDVLQDRQMIRVQSKTRYDKNGDLLYKFKAKAHSEREIPISKDLMARIVAHIKDSAHPKSRLVFCTATGLPDTHIWDRLQTIVKNGGFGHFDLKTFRATRATEWLRPKWLGGFGYDVPTVRDLLGHDEDSESIWSYLRAVEMEVLIAEMNKQQPEKNLEKNVAPLKSGSVLMLEKNTLAVTGNAYE